MTTRKFETEVKSATLSDHSFTLFSQRDILKGNSVQRIGCTG